MNLHAENFDLPAASLMRHSSGRLIPCALLLLFACFGSLLHAEDRPCSQADSAQQASSYTLTVSANLVTVDVTVKDAEGMPVHHLAKDDFVVEEDGKPQQIRSFEGFDLSRMSYVPPPSVSLPPNTFTNLSQNVEQGPLTILLYDLVNTPISDQPQARAALLRFLEQKPAGLRIAIFVLSDGLHLVQGFTSDGKVLAAAVDTGAPKPHLPRIFTMGSNFGQGDKSTAISAIQTIAQFVAPLAGKKNLIWLSSDFPLSLFPSADGNENLQEEAIATLSLLAQHQIAVYPVDASGVRIADEYAPAGSLPGSEPGMPLRQPPPSATVRHGYSLVSQSYITQDEIAGRTGGEAVYSTNDLLGALNKVTRDAGSYYSLAYAPQNENFDGRLRHIEVKLRQRGYSLAYRRSYYGVKAAKDADPMHTRIAAVIRHGEPELHQVIFGVRAAPASTPSPNTRSLPYTLTYRVMAQPSAPQGACGAEYEIAAAAYDPEGKLVNSVVNVARATQTGPKSSPQASYRIEQELDVPKASKFLRVGVRDLASGKVGALEITLAPLP